MSMTVSKISNYLYHHPRFIFLIMFAVSWTLGIVMHLMTPEMFMVLVTTIMISSLLVISLQVWVHLGIKGGKLSLKDYLDNDGPTIHYLFTKKEKVNVDGESAAEGQPEPTDSGK